MTPRAFIRMLAVSAAVTGSLALWHSPAKAAVTRPSAEPPTGYPATLIVQTVPVIKNVRVILDGIAHATNAHGFVAIPTVSGEHRIEIADLAEAVAPELERVDHASEAPLTRVERVLPAVHRAGIAVRHDHLADRHAVRDRAAVDGDVVQHQSLVRIHRDVQ